ncbi:glycosyltransferase family 4 protein [Histidinibacterium aquaticum]|uniref:Glycosyltransferase family 4 protein n=1 Tax=Histidinibacterium aquaticum TaxID=2613962 RepID=A0A5J5GIF6_9RHOB|nr:glycosyltransferase family 4 protein [Histidinibacterium aquaticum]KAA9007830.1 glycosyltransferase family 4 protein [Histidinibacterium aquaticum]
MPHTVLHVAETVQGGIAGYLRMCLDLPRDAFDQKALVPSCQRAHLPEDPRILTYPETARGPRAVLALARHLRRAVRECAPDLLYLHSTLSLLALALVRPDVPVLYCPHGWAAHRFSGTGPRDRAIRSLESRLAGLADRTVNVSRNDAALARHLGYGGRQVVVENAVPPPVPDARSDLFGDGLNLLFVGRFDRQKGLDLLLEAFARARRDRPDLRLHLAGAVVRGGIPTDLPEGAEPLGWVDPGRIDDLYRSVDAVVLPSRWEGLPLVLPEALRNGTPVICSDRAGLPDLVEEGVTGHVLPLCVESWGRRLATLDAARLRAMRPACRAAWAARFDVARFHREISAQMVEAARPSPTGAGISPALSARKSG